MQTDIGNVLSDLITLSDDADKIIFDSNFGNDQGKWFSIIKETANAIVKGTFENSVGAVKSSCFTKDNLPSLVTLVNNKQNSYRVSNLLSEVQKDNRSRLSHRKSRKSLRKIVLGKKSGNQWKISNRKSSVNNSNDNKEPTPIPKVPDRLLESEFKTPLRFSTNKNRSELDSGSKRTQTDFSTPVQSKSILAPNTSEKTPCTRSKLKLALESTGPGKVSNNETYICAESNKPSNKSDKETSQIVKKKSADDEFSKLENNTIIIESNDSLDKVDSAAYTTPVTRLKRKSSVQHTQENAKRIKSSTSHVPSRKNSRKQEDKLPGKNPFKQIKSAKDMNAVIPSKNILPPVKTPAEKRILKEIQKKEEKITQNTKKLQSLQKMKIEENKKAREKKMEKAMQVRMKMEKEKEERIRSRTHSRQENSQMTEPKKGTQKKIEPPKKVRISPVVQKLQMQKSPTKIADATYVNSLNEESNATAVKAPPKPIRNTKKQVESSGIKSTSDLESTKKHLYETMSKDSAYNSGVSAKYESHLSSTPAPQKSGSKTNFKTPVMNKAKKPNSYVMTPHESSFVSYDISEIKSDDSDDEEESAHQKPIPVWASGINLKTALVKQHYAPIDVEELFGNKFDPPILSDIMGMEKRHYHKRTSSAIWLDSPNRSRSYYT